MTFPIQEFISTRIMKWPLVYFPRVLWFIIQLFCCIIVLPFCCQYLCLLFTKIATPASGLLYLSTPLCILVYESLSLLPLFLFFLRNNCYGNDFSNLLHSSVSFKCYKMSLFMYLNWMKSSLTQVKMITHVTSKCLLTNKLRKIYNDNFIFFKFNRKLNT